MRADTAESYRERVQRVLVYIQSRLDGPLSLEELAAVAHFSPYHFHRIFRGLVGESVMEHIRRLRLERAAHRLRHTAEPITGIAFGSGYESHEAFTRAFRGMFGDSPSGYRESCASRAPEPVLVHYSPDGSPWEFHPAPPATPPLAVTIKTIGPLRVAFARHVGAFDEVGEAWRRIMAWAGRHGLIGPGFRTLGIMHDDPDITPPQSLRYDAAVVVGEAALAEGDIGIQEIAAAQYASARHRGPYSRLSDTYARLCGEWLPQSGRELAPAPTIEIYANDPFTTRLEDLLTEIHMALL